MINLLCIGILLHLLLFNTYNDQTTIFQILYHYSSLDIFFFISLFFQIYWLIFLFQYAFKYLELDSYIKIRLSLKNRIIFYSKKTLEFSMIYILCQSLIMIIFHYYPIHDIIYNLLNYYISILLAFIICKNKENVLTIMIIWTVISRLY